ncbi:MAG: hypothetical protein AAF916_09220 [Planctomycetota bacterium]
MGFYLTQLIYRRVCVLIGTTIILTTIQASGALVWYYDPADGQVYFDPTQTRSGTLLGFHLATNGTDLVERVLPGQTLFFNENNRIYVTGPGISFNTNVYISEYFNNSIAPGVHTIGRILPPNLPAETWYQFANDFSNSPSELSPEELLLPKNSYIDQYGGGKPPAAEFIYGPPASQAVNEWSLEVAQDVTWATKSRLLYDPSNGDVYLDSQHVDNGGYISLISISSSHPLLHENAIDYPAAIGQLVSETSYLMLATAIDSDLYNLGNILPPGLTLEEFRDAFTGSYFVASTDVFSDDREQLPFLFGTFPIPTRPLIPEPSIILFFTLSTLALNRFGRRRLDHR